MIKHSNSALTNPGMPGSGMPNSAAGSESGGVTTSTHTFGNYLEPNGLLRGDSDISKSENVSRCSPAYQYL